MTVATTYVSPLSGTMDLSNGAIVSEANLDAFASDILCIAGTTGHIGAYAYNSAAIGVANNSSTALTFNSESYDTDPNGELHSTASNTGRLTCRTAGKYLVAGAVEWAANATGQRNLQIRLNGSATLKTDNRMNLSGSYPCAMTVSVVVDLAAGDYVELMAFQDSGGALNAGTSGTWSPGFLMTKV